MGGFSAGDVVFILLICGVICGIMTLVNRSRKNK